MNHHGEIGPFFKKTVCIVERATHPCVSPVGRFKEEGGWDRCFSFFPMQWGKEKEGAAPCCQIASAPGDRGQTFDDAGQTLK